MRLLSRLREYFVFSCNLIQNEQATDLYDNRRMDENAFKSLSLSLSFLVLYNAWCECRCMRECNDLGRYFESFFTRNVCLFVCVCVWVGACVVFKRCRIFVLQSSRFLVILWMCMRVFFVCFIFNSEISCSSWYGDEDFYTILCMAISIWNYTIKRAVYIIWLHEKKMWKWEIWLFLEKTGGERRETNINEKMFHWGHYGCGYIYVVRCRCCLFYVGKFDVPWRNNVQYIYTQTVIAREHFLGWPSPSLWIWVLYCFFFSPLFFVHIQCFFYISTVVVTLDT